MKKVKLSDAIRERKSTRAFSEKRFPEEWLQKILEAGRLAPSAINRQPWRFYIIEGPVAKKKLMDSLAWFNSFAGKAPVLIVVLAKLDDIWSRHSKKDFFDLGLCVENILLTATDLGLSCCVLAGIDFEKLKKKLALPAKLQPVVVIPLGFENKGESVAAKFEKAFKKPFSRHLKRKPLEELVFKRE